MCLQRRCYWLLGSDNDIVLVHYLSNPQRQHGSRHGAHKDKPSHDALRSNTAVQDLLRIWKDDNQAPDLPFLQQDYWQVRHHFMLIVWLCMVYRDACQCTCTEQFPMIQLQAACLLQLCMPMHVLCSCTCAMYLPVSTRSVCSASTTPNLHETRFSPDTVRAGFLQLATAAAGCLMVLCVWCAAGRRLWGCKRPTAQVTRAA